MAKPKQIVLDGTTLKIALEERLDTSNATQLIEKLGRYKEDEITRIEFDATKLKYIASTGIRAVIFANQMVDGEPELVFIGTSNDVYKVFETTGISDFITFK